MTDVEFLVYAGKIAFGYGLGILIFIWTRWIVIRAWKVK